MATFKAFNADSEDEVEDDLDNTRELEIEEALKIYQRAVKSQAQGPHQLLATEAAYEELFQSEIFTYPDALSELRREATYGELLQDSTQHLPKPEYVAIDSQDVASNTLPQVLHLAYKNRGQFHLDSLSAALKDTQGSIEKNQSVIKAHGVKALNDLSEALDKDADDVDVWRRAARAGRLLGSLRTARFCLEAVVDGDEQGTDDILGDAGVDIKLADQDLRDLKVELNDADSYAPPVARTSHLPKLWRKQLALYPDIPELSPSSVVLDPEEIHIHTDERSWASLGASLLPRLSDEHDGLQASRPGSYVRLIIPEMQVGAEIRDGLNGGKHFITPNAKTGGPELSCRRGSTVLNRRDTFSTGGPDNLLSPGSETPNSPPTSTLPARKRSSEVAELPENADGGRLRSKRIKARESLAVDPREVEVKSAEAPAYEQRIKDCAQGDEWLYELLSLLATKSGVKGKRSTKPYRALIREQQAQGLGESSKLPLGQAVQDFYNMMQEWDQDKSDAMLGDSRDVSPGDSHDTLQAFLEASTVTRKKRPDRGSSTSLDIFTESVNNDRMPLPQVACEWLSHVCGTYLVASWSADFKQTVLDLLVAVDRHVFAQFDEILKYSPTRTSVARSADLSLVQTLFELHLEKHVAMNNPSSAIDDTFRAEQKARMDRWAFVARELVCLQHDEYTISGSDAIESTLLMRHVWASVFHLQATAAVPQQELIKCFEQLKQELLGANVAYIELPNNALMQELTATAADREISKLETMDFFQGIFKNETRPPVDLIESLEPLLERTIASEENFSFTADDLVEDEGLSQKSLDDVKRSTTTMEVLTRFLSKASPNLRLLLWIRLRDAYQAIDYQPKVLSIQMRCIQVTMEGLKSDAFKAKSKEERRLFILETIRDLREILDSVWLLLKGENGPSRFECFDISHIQASISALLDLSLLLYAVCLFDDHSQIGGKGGPTVNPFRSYPSDTFHTASIKLHNMQVQTFILLYRLFGEVMVQAPQSFPLAAEDKLQFLRYVHYHFGTRRMCKALDSSFLHFVKDQVMNRLPGVEHLSSNELAQVLYDLYDLQCFSSPSERQNHGCDQDYLDHANAMQLVDFVLEKASVTNTKDLLKSDLGKAVDKLHSTLDWVVTRPAASKRNSRIYNALMRSQILPVSLFRALKGLTDIPAVPVKASEAIVASKGWFFLKGQLALARFRAQRSRNTPGDEDDLHSAKQFFQQDLEFSPERWETWYRMAQAYELLVEENVMWNADPMNTDPQDVIDRQRAAIHAYTLAVAMSARNAEPSAETITKLSELYVDFASCLYAATREPFSGRAISHESTPSKHFWEQDGESQYEGRLFHPLTNGEAWKVAAVLLRRAAVLKPDSWIIPHMLAKCYWKLHQRSDGRVSSIKAVQRCLTQAVELLPNPKRKDSTRDPIMEPIYKVIAVTHKLVAVRKELQASEGAAFIDEHLDLQNQIDASKRPKLFESSSWDVYVLNLLKMLRAADKSRWHHRPVLRAAGIMQDEEGSLREGALIAKEYLAEQHIFSAKTMAMNVWKPDNERPGRHHVYMTRYCLYLVKLLEATSDLEGIQLVAKRVRKKSGEFFEHEKLWTVVMGMHLTMHERHVHIEHDCADWVFRDVDQDRFKPMANQIDAWIQQPDNPSQAPYCEVLKEIVELKKLNGNLAKFNNIDDLIADVYAEVWRHASPSSRALRPRKVSAPTTETSVPPTDSTFESAAKTTTEDEQIRPADVQHALGTDGTFERPVFAPRPSTPVSGPITSNDQPQAPQQSSTPTKFRARLISRREILKRASDSVLVKPVVRAPSPVRRASTSLDSSHIKVVINTPGAHRLYVNGTEVDGTAPNSAPVSVHDSADDESELSSAGEDDEDEAPAVPPLNRPTFPNLMRLSGNSFTPGRIGGAEEGANGEVLLNRMDVDEDVQQDPGGKERTDAM